MDRVFFTNSGTESIEGAIKLAKKYAYLKTGRTDSEIIAMHHSFHGRSMGALAVTGNKHYQEAFGPMIPGIKFANYNDLESVIISSTSALVITRGGTILITLVPAENSISPLSNALAITSLGLIESSSPCISPSPLLSIIKSYSANYNDLESVKQLVNDKTCAIIFETVQGEGGIYPATNEFIKGVRQLCDEKGILLILDEIQCGMGRTGTMFAFQQYGVEPDILTVAKALGCGLPP